MFRVTAEGETALVYQLNRQRFSDIRKHLEEIGPIMGCKSKIMRPYNL